jgi:membrane protease YdiL (CAAX protease family)
MPPAVPALVQIIQVVVFAVLIGGSLAAWSRVSIRLASGQSVLSAEPRRPVPWNLGHVAAIAAIYFLLQAGGALIVHRFFPASPAAAEVVANAVDKNLLERAVEPQKTDKQPAEKNEKGAGKKPKDSEEKAEPLDPQKMAAGILIHIFASVLALVIAVPLLRGTARCTWADLGIVPDKLLSDIKLGLTGFAAAAVPIYGMQFALSRWSTKRHPIIDWLEKSPDTNFLLLAGISTVLVAPLAEEFFFRLIFQGWLERLAAYRWPKASNERERVEDAPGLSTLAATRASDNPSSMLSESGDLLQDVATAEVVPAGGIAGWGPIVCSAFIFALMHFDHGPAPIPLFFLALLLGYLYQKTHRILPSIVVHCCLNSCSMLILWTSLLK